MDAILFDNLVSSHVGGIVNQGIADVFIHPKARNILNFSASMVIFIEWHFP